MPFEYVNEAEAPVIVIVSPEIEVDTVPDPAIFKVSPSEIVPAVEVSSTIVKPELVNLSFPISATSKISPTIAKVELSTLTDKVLPDLFKPSPAVICPAPEN